MRETWVLFTWNLHESYSYVFLFVKVILDKEKKDNFPSSNCNIKSPQRKDFQWRCYFPANLGSVTSNFEGMKRPESTLAALLLVAALSVAVVVADIDGFPYNDGPGLCALMDNNYPARSTSPFSSGANTSASVCLAGTAKTDAKSDVLRVDNLFRYLIGLDPAPNYESAQDKRTQECALMCAANTGLNHQWPSTANCFTADGDAGCRSSNLAMGRSNPSDIMSQYIQDNNVANLGHRRWIFSPTLDKISFGAIGVYSSLYVFWNTKQYEH